MASITRVERSPFWHCNFTLPDGRRTKRSTGTSDKKKAQAICDQWEQAALDAKEGRLTEARARDTIATIFQIANKETLPQSTTKDFLDSWLKTKALTLAPSSLSEYTVAVNGFLAHIGTVKAGRHMDAVTVRDAASFRDALAKRVSGTTTNKTVKIMRVAWNRALRDGFLRDNVFARVDLVREDAALRRAFTVDELKAILSVCDTEWRGMVLCGAGLGLRLGDVAKLTWRNVDLERKEIRFTAQKTKRVMVIPISTCPDLLEYFESLPSSDALDAPVFARAASQGRTSMLSNQFAGILAAAGLQEARTTHDKAENGKGRAAKRETAGRLSFHCCRHTFVSNLKAGGVSNAVAQALAGHESEAVNRVYTHIPTAVLSEALAKLPRLLPKKTIEDLIQ